MICRLRCSASGRTHGRAWMWAIVGLAAPLRLKSNSASTFFVFYAYAMEISGYTFLGAGHHKVKYCSNRKTKTKEPSKQFDYACPPHLPLSKKRRVIPSPSRPVHNNIDSWISILCPTFRYLQYCLLSLMLQYKYWLVCI